MKKCFFLMKIVLDGIRSPGHFFLVKAYIIKLKGLTPNRLSLTLPRVWIVDTF